MKLPLVLLGAWMTSALVEDGLAGTSDNLLSRKKRYIVFPEGSTFVMGICETISLIVYPQNTIWTQSIDMYLGYDLPNETYNEHYNKYGEYVPSAAEHHRRSRRDLYHSLEVVLNIYGLNGRECILRTICESSQKLVPRTSMFIEMLRSLFTLPQERVRPSEPQEHVEYDSAHRRGLANHDCQDVYPDCPSSPLDLVLPILHPAKDYQDY